MSRHFWEWPEEIKAFRRECGLTQQGLAARLGITKKIVADWEQGRQEPSARRWIEMARMARAKRALSILGWIGLDRRFLARLAPYLQGTRQRAPGRRKSGSR